MERITYRITLDTHRNGIQRTLQGFETADKMSRRIAINLVSSGDTYDLPLVGVVAVMYVTTPKATEPSINACTIEDNTIIYDVLPIVEEGITEMQLKLIGGGLEGTKAVLVSPRFAVEVTDSGTNDDSAEQSTTFTALEDAIAKAQGVYNSRMQRVEIDSDCTFKIYYADGSVYENDVLRQLLYDGNVLLSESWAKGGTGVRAGEDTNNSKYYSDVAKSASADANIVSEEARDLLDEAKLHTAYTIFSVDFKTGELTYLTSNYSFDINQETGDLEAMSGSNYNPEGLVGEMVSEYVDTKSKEVDEKLTEFDERTNNLRLAYDLLWENQDPSVAFPAQEVNLGEDIMSRYDMFCITYKQTISATYDQYYIFLKNRHAYDTDYVTGTPGGYVSAEMLEFSFIDNLVTPIRRIVVPYADKIQFADGVYFLSDGKTNTHNLHLIPGKIYGVRIS